MGAGAEEGQGVGTTSGDREHWLMFGVGTRSQGLGFPPLRSPGAEPWAGSIRAWKEDGSGQLGLGLGVPGTGAGRGLALRSRGAASAHAGLTQLQPAPTATPGSMKDRTQELRTVSQIPARRSPRAL